jgi:ribulose-5-phosphate 4-epimerase/fuculose-1-phosphate aldolase
MTQKKIFSEVDKKFSQPKDITALKKNFCAWCRLLYERHLVSGSGGNLAARAGNSVMLTPTGCSLRDLKPSLVVTVDLSGNSRQGGIPTREAPMHLKILQERRDINVVCHVHGAYIIAAGTMLTPGPESIPPVTPGFAYTAYPLPLIPYLPPGSEALSRAVADVLSSSQCKAVLLKSHGLVTAGSDYPEAINLAEEIEEAAHIYVLTSGKAPSLTV